MSAHPKFTEAVSGGNSFFALDEDGLLWFREDREKTWDRHPVQPPGRCWRLWIHSTHESGRGEFATLYLCALENPPTSRIWRFTLPICPYTYRETGLPEGRTYGIEKPVEWEEI